MVAEMAAGDWLVLVRHELFLFAGTFFLIGAIDEFAVDIVYIWLRITGRANTQRIDGKALNQTTLSERWAVLVPAWQEAGVIAATITHARAAWPQATLRIFIGCYRNDPETQHAARLGAGGDARVTVTVHDVDGPTCKADCLNRLYRAVEDDELQEGKRFRAIVLHDAEDMVDPLALPLLAAAMERNQFLQVPVLALPQRRSPLVAGHYTDEFAEAHCRSLVVRSALGRGIPGAGVGCAIDRKLLTRIAAKRDSDGPFATGALTEDYELGLQCAAMGARSRFLRMRTGEGRLVATRAYFPSSMSASIRQKTRWMHGIAFQGWDRMGWRGGPVAIWMQLRDRRGPLAALMLAVAYLLVVLTGLDLLMAWFGLVATAPLSEPLQWLLVANLLALIWRLTARMAFTAREYGWRQGLLAVPRVLVSNTVAIVAARRALFAYIRSLFGERVTWDKTHHDAHPVVGETVASGSNR